MSWEDHTCEECSQWDSINGCWADQDTRGALDTCPMNDAIDYDEDYTMDSTEDFDQLDDHDEGQRDKLPP